MARKVIGMTRNVVGPTGGWRRRWGILFSLMVIVGAGVAIVFAVHDTGAFQLDGDAATGTNTAGTPAAADDWDKVCYEVAVEPVAQGGGGLTPAQATAKCGINVPTTGAIATAWVEEPAHNSTIFTGGGSKDPIDIDQWAWKNDEGGLPDKDNLVHAYAARYSLPPGPDCGAGGNETCDVIYFGSDRFDNSGDAQQGFWFLQNAISLGTNKVGGATGFASSVAPEFHKPGDLLVISDFSNGGGTSTITVYKWDPTCQADNRPDVTCDDTNLRLLANLTGLPAKCDTASANDPACGIVNPILITMPWSFTDKSGTPGNGALNGEFFEAGINLSLLNLAGECFSTMVAETRSSTSTTAVLKDFVLGNFGVCAPTLSTSVQGLDSTRTVLPGQQVQDLATVTVTGASAPADAQGTVDFFLCGPSASGNPDCSTGGTSAGSGKVLADISSPPNANDGISGAFSNFVNTSASPLAPGFYCFRAEAHLTNYDSPPPFTDSTNECFRVREVSRTTTAQDWLPNDTATVVLGSGAQASGSVTFSLFLNGNCTGAPAAQFVGIPLVGGTARTNNTTVFTASTTVSWRVTFTPTDPNVVGSTSNCEISTLGIDNVGIP
jgi:hypothetical protein